MANELNGAMGGAGAGASIGMLGGPVGAGIGAGVGGILGLIGAMDAADEAEKALKEQRALEEAQRKQDILMKAAETRFAPWSKITPSTQVSKVGYSPITEPGATEAISGLMSGAKGGASWASLLASPETTAATYDVEAQPSVEQGFQMPEQGAQFNSAKPTLYRRKA